MRLDDIMSRPVERITPQDAAEAAYQIMKTRRIHHLVVMEEGRVVGIVSDRDLGGVRGAEQRRNKRVGELMEPSVVTAAEDTTVRQAANLMRGRAIGCLPVVRGRRVVGIVTVADLLELIGRGVSRPIEESVRWTLRRRGPRRRPRMDTRRA